MAAIKIERDWFFPKSMDGNLSLSTQEERINQALAVMQQGDWLEVDGIKCCSRNEILAVLRQSYIQEPMNRPNPQSEPLMCPHCGAPLTVDISTGALICQYCKSIIAVSTEPRVEDMGHGVRFILRTVEPELEYGANFNDGISAQGGKLWITREEVVFKPHKFNLGNLGKKYIRIQDVAGYSKGFLTLFSIWTKNGDEMPLVVWKKNEIIQEIEKRRHEFFESRGMITPELKYGNVAV